MIKFISDYESPQKAHRVDAGWDIFAPEDFVVPADLVRLVGDTYRVIDGSVCVNSKVCVDIPEGYVGILKSKSGLSVLHNIECVDGVIDSGYTGEVKIKLRNHGIQDYQFKKGDKICQLIILPCVIQDDGWVIEEPRREGGFGSTGK